LFSKRKAKASPQKGKGKEKEWQQGTKRLGRGYSGGVLGGDTGEGASLSVTKGKGGVGKGSLPCGGGDSGQKKGKKTKGAGSSKGKQGGAFIESAAQLSEFATGKKGRENATEGEK